MRPFEVIDPVLVIYQFLIDASISAKFDGLASIYLSIVQSLMSARACYMAFAARRYDVRAWSATLEAQRVKEEGSFEILHNRLPAYDVVSK